MQVIETLYAMRALSDGAREHRARIGFVPTMGFLHEGHLALVRRARTLSDVVVVSIFVNPMQFAPSEDLARYPRDPSGDMEKLESAGCDVLFLPDQHAIYPPDFSTVVFVDGITAHYEGEFRPDHFQGVTTVVTKLLNVVRPRTAVFGQKDAQQLAVVRRMVRDLDMGIEIEAVETIRDPDGLAMSSRNVYLSPEERSRALSISRSLAAACGRYADGASLDAVRSAMVETLDGNVSSIDYADIVVESTFTRADEGDDGPLLAVIAARVGTTRLIDNAQLRR